jgi:hypothetical protein
LLDPSNLDIKDPNELDFAKAALNLRASKVSEGSMCPVFLTASTKQVSAWSQQFINLGPYVGSKRSNMAAFVNMV